MLGDVMEEAVDEPQMLQSYEIDPQMMHDIKLLLSYLVAKASQLIENFTNSLAEGWMHVGSLMVASKYIGQ